MKTLQSVLYSGRGMAIVDALFCLSLLLRRSGVILIAYAVWIVYLALGVKLSESRAVKLTNAALIAFAAAMIVVNVGFLVKG